MMRILTLGGNYLKGLSNSDYINRLTDISFSVSIADSYSQEWLLTYPLFLQELVS